MAIPARFGISAAAAVSTYLIGGTVLCYCSTIKAGKSSDDEPGDANRQPIPKNFPGVRKPISSDVDAVSNFSPPSNRLLSSFVDSLISRISLPPPPVSLCDGGGDGCNEQPPHVSVDETDDVDGTNNKQPSVKADGMIGDNSVDNADDDGYPNFTRHGKSSIIARYLTREVYNELKHLKTPKFGVTLEDLIRSGVSLPFGANPPRGMAVFAGDADCYHIFAPLFIPLLEEYHGVTLDWNAEKRNLPPSSDRSRRMLGEFRPSASTSQKELQQSSSPSLSTMKRKAPSRLRRQVTNLNPHFVLSQNLDPTGEYILYSRMRVSRSLEGFPFAPSIQRSQRRQVERLFRSCIEDWKEKGDTDDFSENKKLNFNKEWLELSANGAYYSVMDMTNAQHADLIQRHILFEDPDELALLAGIGRDWPDGRGVYCNDMESPEIMIWCNSEDHLRVISMRKGGDLLGVFTRLSVAVSAVEQSLRHRGFQFASDRRLGFLNTSPSNVGTAFKASVYVKLVRLGQQPGFYDLIHRLRLEAMTRFEGDDKRYTGIFDIANAERLGQTEVELINTMINGVGRLIDLEKKLERGEQVDLSTIR